MVDTNCAPQLKISPQGARLVTSLLKSLWRGLQHLKLFPSNNLKRHTELHCK